MDTRINQKHSMILGIDPGFTGALALYEPGENNLSVVDMPVGKDPKNGRSVVDYISLYNGLRLHNVSAILEFVAARPGQGAASIFRFGEGYGAIQMALAAHKIPVQKVTPQKWKAHFGLKGKTPKDVDAGARTLARERFPEYAELFSRVKDSGRADAALIALYGAEKLLT